MPPADLQPDSATVARRSHFATLSLSLKTKMYNDSLSDKLFNLLDDFEDLADTCCFTDTDRAVCLRPFLGDDPKPDMKQLPRDQVNSYRAVKTFLIRMYQIAGT